MNLYLYTDILSKISNVAMIQFFETTHQAPNQLINHLSLNQRPSLTPIETSEKIMCKNTHSSKRVMLIDGF